MFCWYFEQFFVCLPVRYKSVYVWLSNYFYYHSWCSLLPLHLLAHTDTGSWHLRKNCPFGSLFWLEEKLQQKYFFLRCPRSNYSHNFQCCCIKMFWCLRLSWTISIQGWVGQPGTNQRRAEQDVRGCFHPMANKSGVDINQRRLVFFSMLIM